MYLDKDRIECVDKDKAPIPRRGDSRVVLTPLSRRNDAASHGADAPLTQQ